LVLGAAAGCLFGVSDIALKFLTHAAVLSAVRFEDVGAGLDDGWGGARRNERSPLPRLGMMVARAVWLSRSGLRPALRAPLTRLS
jgi:hypothetical protein